MLTVIALVSQFSRSFLVMMNYTGISDRKMNRVQLHRVV